MVHLRDQTEFPLELFIELEQKDYLVGRLIVHQMNRGFWTEVDIVLKESKKIWAHCGALHGILDLDEATYQGVQKMSEYISSKNL